MKYVSWNVNGLRASILKMPVTGHFLLLKFRDLYVIIFFRLRPAEKEKELLPDEIFDLFKTRYEDITTPFNITEAHFKQHNGIIAEIMVEHDGEKKLAVASGNGRLDAISNALKKQCRV